MADTENSVDLSLGQVVSGLAGSDGEFRGQHDLQQLLGIEHLNVEDITVGMRRRDRHMLRLDRGDTWAT